MKYLFLILSLLVFVSCGESSVEPLGGDAGNDFSLNFDKVNDEDIDEVYIGHVFVQETNQTVSHTVTGVEFTVNGAGSTNWPLWLYYNFDDIEQNFEYYRIRVKRNGTTVRTKYATSTSGVINDYFNMNNIGVGVVIQIEVTYFHNLAKSSAVTVDPSFCNVVLETNFGY